MSSFSPEQPLSHTCNIASLLLLRRLFLWQMFCWATFPNSLNTDSYNWPVTCHVHREKPYSFPSYSIGKKMFHSNSFFSRADTLWNPSTLIYCISKEYTYHICLIKSCVLKRQEVAEAIMDAVFETSSEVQLNSHLRWTTAERDQQHLTIFI